MSKRILLLFLSLFLLTFSSKSQEVGKVFSRYYSPRDYDAGVQNWAITQDDQGVLYVGQYGNVLQYDGISWRKIPVSNRSNVRSISKKSDGSILVGAVNEMGELMPDNTGNLFFKSYNDKIDSTYYNYGEVWSCFNSSAGDYFQTDDYLFHILNDSSAVWEPEGEYFYLMFRVEERLFIHDFGAGLKEIIGDELKELPGSRFFKNYRVHGILPYGNQGYMICTRNQGIFLWNPSKPGGEIKSLASLSSEAAKNNDYFIKNKIYTSEVISDSVYAIGNLQGGAIIMNSRGEVVDILNEETAGISSAVYDMHYGKNGNLWLALDNGVQRVELSVPFRYWDKDLGLGENINTLYFYDDNFYVAASRGVFIISEEEKDGPSIYKARPVEGIDEPVWYFLTLYPTPDDWEGNLPYEPEQKMAKLPILDETFMAFSYQGVYAIEQDQANHFLKVRDMYYFYLSRFHASRMYLGRRNGLTSVSYKKGIWINNGTLQPLKASVNSIQEDAEGNLWFGMNYRGVGKLDKKYLDYKSGFFLDTLAKYVEIYDTLKGLPSVQNIYVGYYDSLIYTYVNNQVYYYNDSLDTFTKDTVYKEEPVTSLDSNQTDIFYMDLNRGLWINSYQEKNRAEDGRFYPDSITIHRLDDYLLKNYYVENGNEVWIGSAGNLFKYEEKYGEKYTRPYPALIRSVTMGSDSLIFNGACNSRFALVDSTKTSLECGNQIRIKEKIPAALNSFVFTYSAPYFIDEEKIRFSYKLENFDDNWSIWTKETKKEYTNLPPGKYTFKVRAKNLYNLDSTFATCQFEVMPPWYQTWFAYLIYSLALIFLIVVIVKIYSKRLIREKEKLERIVKERTQEINQQKEEIQVQAEHLKDANAFITQKNKELEQQKKEISSQAEKLKAANIELLKLSKVASETDNAIAIYDELGNLEWVNDGFKRLYGYTKEDFIKNRGENILESNTNPEIIGKIKESLELKKSVVFETTTTTRDGRQLWLQTGLSHVTDEAGNTVNLISIDSDITEIKRAEKEIQDQRDLLAISNATKNKFFRIIAHDLRNPISTLVSSTSLLMSDVESFSLERLTKFVTSLNKLSQTTFNLLENLLDWSATQMGDIPYRPNYTDIKMLINENLELIKSKLEDKSIDLQVQLNDELTAWVDENMIRTVIRNLLSNAAKFTPEEGKIIVSAQQEKEKLLLVVKDTGVGIADEDLEKLFRIDVHHTTRGVGNEQGSGLGLILCKEFVEKNHGSIHIDSTINEETTVSVQLPVKAVE